MSGAQEAPPAVSLIVVNYEGADRLRPCVESLLAEREPSRELFVVDNASSDQSLFEIEPLVAQEPRLRVLRLDENHGYAGGVNAALPHCRGRHVGVLNMDLVAEPGWLSPLVDFLDSHPEVGAVGPMLALEDGETVNALGQDVHVTGLGFNRGLGSRRSEIGEEPFPVSGLQGAAFLVRRGLLEQMGGMDESGFLYHEDVHLSWLLRLMGHELYCVPGSVVRHDYFLSMHAEKLFLLERNRLALLLSCLEPATLLRLSARLLMTEGMLWSYALLRGPSFLRAKARSYATLWRERASVGARREKVAALRRRSDHELLQAMTRRYAWRQFATLAGERGTPRGSSPDISPPGA